MEKFCDEEFNELMGKIEVNAPDKCEIIHIEKCEQGYIRVDILLEDFGKLRITDERL